MTPEVLLNITCHGSTLFNIGTLIAVYFDILHNNKLLHDGFIISIIAFKVICLFLTNYIIFHGYSQGGITHKAIIAVIYYNLSFGGLCLMLQLAVYAKESLGLYSVIIQSVQVTCLIVLYIKTQHVDTDYYMITDRDGLVQV